MCPYFPNLHESRKKSNSGILCGICSKKEIRKANKNKKKVKKRKKI